MQKQHAALHNGYTIRRRSPNTQPSDASDSCQAELRLDGTTVGVFSGVRWESIMLVWYTIPDDIPHPSLLRTLQQAGVALPIEAWREIVKYL